MYHYDAHTLKIIPWGDNAFRVQCYEQAEAPTEDWALLPANNTYDALEVTEDGGKITNGKITAIIENDGYVTFENSENKVLIKEFRSPGYLNIKARELTPTPKGEWEINMRFESDPNEKIYGMGQYQQEFLNLKGCDIELAHRNSQESVPFYYSTSGYGFLWNTPAVGHAYFCRNYTTWAHPTGKYIDYWIVAGDSPKEIEQGYTNVTGKVPMMPDYAMGFWQSKCRYRTQEELLGVAREYKRRGLPLDVIVIDFFHWVLQGDWTLDPKYWPDPVGMCKELEEMGVETMVSFWQTVDKRCERYPEMVEKGYLMQMDRGPRMSINYMCDSVYYDAFNDDARQYVWAQLKKNYYDLGIHNFWLDQSECDCPGYEYDIYRFQKGRASHIVNYYPAIHVKGIYEGLRSAGQELPVILTRSAWCGAQRYGALLWSGDIISTFQAMRRQVCAGLNTAIAGIPWWTTDIGGFYNGYNDDPSFRELMQRWVAFGAFSPVMRFHGVRKPETPMVEGDPNVFGSGADNEVWSFGEETYEVCKKYLLLRQRMKPYIKSLMQEAHEVGNPVIRPMFYEYPEQDNMYDLADQYMFGGDMLVAPVMYENMTERSVVLPAGETWIYAWTGEEVEGGQTVTVETPKDIIPVYVKKSSDGIKYLRCG
ncbi:MAG: glycoside hydrolase family 31 protein [Eubacteriales bacterium]